MSLTHRGPYGTAEEIPISDIPSASETVCSWILTAPQAHPLWTQYNLAVIRLRNVPDRPAPVLKFQGATHQTFLFAIDPGHGVWTADRALQGFLKEKSIPLLHPVNWWDQFEGTDTEMSTICSGAANAVTQGVLCPETGDAPDRIRMDWLRCWTKTLAHLRGEAHAR